MNHIDKDIEKMQWKIQGLTECCGGVLNVEWIYEREDGKLLGGYYNKCRVCSKCNEVIVDTGIIYMDTQKLQ